MFVDKEMFSLCMHLDKIYENEGLGAEVFEKYLELDERFSVVKEITLEPHINLSSMDKLPEFLSYVWVLEKIKKQIERLFLLNQSFRSGTVAYDELGDDYNLIDILGLFSRDENRKTFKDVSRYPELMEIYAKLENAVDRLEASGGVALLCGDQVVSCGDLLKGQYLVLSSKKHDIATIKASLNFRDKEVNVKKNAVKLIVTSSTIKQAKEW